MATTEAAARGGERPQAGLDSLYYPSGRLALKLPSDPLLPEGHDFSEDEVLVTSWGGVLPSVEFSRQQFEELQAAADTPKIYQSEEVILLARYLTSKKGFIFDETTGCWHLPLAAFYDDKKRARYPRITLGALGVKNGTAHRIALSILRGEPVDNLSVDHLCRNHSCCNPYHLEPVEGGINTSRGATARRAETIPTLFQNHPGTVACSHLINNGFAELA